MGKAFIHGSIDDTLSVEAVYYLLDWKVRNPQFMTLDTLTYLKFEEHFNSEYESIFLTNYKIYVSLH